MWVPLWILHPVTDGGSQSLGFKVWAVHGKGFEQSVSRSLGTLGCSEPRLGSVQRIQENSLKTDKTWRGGGDPREGEASGVWGAEHTGDREAGTLLGAHVLGSRRPGLRGCTLTLMGTPEDAALEGG